MNKEEILLHYKDAAKLENLYRLDKAAFRKVFLEASGEIPDGAGKDFWLERLKQDKTESISWGGRQNWLLVLLAGIAGGIVLKIPGWFHLVEDDFFPRNLGFAFAPVLMLFLGLRSRMKATRIFILLILITAAAVYINLLPGLPDKTDSTWLACLHLPVLLWLLLGYADSAGDHARPEKGLGFIRFSAELLVMAVLVLLAGGLFTALLLGLFHSIGYDIRQFYFDWFGIFGIGAIPLVAALLVKENPRLLQQVAPVVAGIFSPLALLALLLYLPALFWSGKNLFTDRDFLLVFNLLLLAVLALIFFSLSEMANNPAGKFSLKILLLLALLTLFVNSLALSAILYRIISLGITANRIAVLGSNLLILCNLFLVSLTLFRNRSNPSRAEKAGNSIVGFLPVYGLWALLMMLFLPMIFGGR